jgi:hypothetical protein
MAGLDLAIQVYLLEVSAVLADAEAVDRLVKALEANKQLLPAKAKNEAAD